MSFAEILALTLTVTALFGYVNHRWVRMPRVIGLMLMGAAVAAVVAAAGRWVPELERTAQATIAAIDFERLVFQGVLAFLLFAGALHLNLNDLRRHAVVIAVLSTVGVLVSTAIIGVLVWQGLALLGIGLPLLSCLLFGALVSPTDPVAVLAVLREVRVPPDVEVQLAGESLFNDCVGVVVFLALLGLAAPAGPGPAPGAATVLLGAALESAGGLVLGIALGAIVFVLIKTVDDYRIEIPLSLALVLGGWALAQRLHVSAPIATVVAGLLIGNHGRLFAMSDATRERLDLFWDVIEAILDAVLFVLIGLLLLTVAVTGQVLLAAMTAIVVTLVARWLSIGPPLLLLRRYGGIATPSVRLMTWAGVRGPLSIALALSLHQRLAAPASPQTSVIVVMTYAVVLFSVAVQGLTLRRAVSRLVPGRAAGPRRH